MAVTSKRKADIEKFKTEVKKHWDITNNGPINWFLGFEMLNNRKVTRLGIEPRPSGKIPDALTTELSGLTGTIHYVLFMYLPLQLGILVI